MPAAEIIEKYLTRVILFKEKQKLYTDFADEPSRATQLKKLFDDLDFDDHLWELKSEIAIRSFKIYEFLDADYEISHSAPKMYETLLEKYLNRAIALDPYNTEYLKEYFNGSVGRTKNNKKLAIHYVSLYHPNTPAFQNLLVDLKLKPSEITFDYLSETVTIPFVNELVFLREKVELHQVEIQSEKKLEDLAKTAGVDSESLEEIKESVPEMVKTAVTVFEDHWLDWTKSYKAILAMEKAIDLAPYNKDVLLTAVSFYGGFYWRLILGYSKIKQTEGKTELMEYVFSVKKPKRETAYLKAVELFQKTADLKERLQQVILNEELENKNKKKDDFYIPDFSNMNRFSMISRKWLRHDKVDYATVQAYVEKETVTFQLLTHHFKSQKNQTQVILISAIPTATICYLLSWWLFQTWFPFFPLFLPVVFIPMIVLYVREKIWQRKKLEIDEVLDRAVLKY